MLLRVQYISRKGFRVCVKELYEAKYDPLFISYIVLSGKNFTAKKKKDFLRYIFSYRLLHVFVTQCRDLLYAQASAQMDGITSMDTAI